MKLHYLVCFDIADNKTRLRVGRLLLRYGQRVQKSVFEIALANTGEMEMLKHKLKLLLDGENELRFYRLCLNCRKASRRVDGMPLATFPEVVII